MPRHAMTPHYSGSTLDAQVSRGVPLAAALAEGCRWLLRWPRRGLRSLKHSRPGENPVCLVFS